MDKEQADDLTNNGNAHFNGNAMSSPSDERCTSSSGIDSDCGGSGNSRNDSELMPAPASTSLPFLSVPTLHSVINNHQSSPVSESDETVSDEEARRRREMLARRPSYRRILNDISGTELDIKQEPMGPAAGFIPPISSTSGDSMRNGQFLSTGDIGASVVGFDPHLNGLIDNHNGFAAQLLVPMSMNGDLFGMRAAAASGHFNHPLAGGQRGNFALGFLSPSGASTPSPGASPNPSMMGMGLNGEHHQLLHQAAIGGDDAHRKREIRLLKNREAAKECRRKKKEYVKCLETRVAVLENQNKALIEELKTLKDLYCRKGDVR